MSCVTIILIFLIFSRKKQREDQLPMIMFAMKFANEYKKNIYIVNIQMQISPLSTNIITTASRSEQVTYDYDSLTQNLISNTVSLLCLSVWLRLSNSNGPNPAHTKPATHRKSHSRNPYHI